MFWIDTFTSPSTFTLNKKAPRKIFLYWKGNIEGLVSDLTKFSDIFCENYKNSKSNGVNLMWTDLKHNILESMEKHIPSKKINSSNHQAAWINSELKREIRKRNRLYSKAKLSNNTNDWDNFKNQKRLTQSAVWKAY